MRCCRTSSRACSVRRTVLERVQRRGTACPRRTETRAVQRTRDDRRGRGCTVLGPRQDDPKLPRRVVVVWSLCCICGLILSSCIVLPIQRIPHCVLSLVCCDRHDRPATASKATQTNLSLRPNHLPVPGIATVSPNPRLTLPSPRSPSRPHAESPASSSSSPSSSTFQSAKMGRRSVRFISLCSRVGPGHSSINIGHPNS